MEIKNTDKLYNPDGKQFRSIGGLYTKDFVGKHIEDLRAGKHVFYLYLAPEDYDPAINKLDGVVAQISDTPYCTEGLIDLTAEEIAAALQAKEDNLFPYLTTPTPSCTVSHQVET